MITPISDRHVLIALTHVPGVGQKTLHNLYEYRTKHKVNLCDFWVGQRQKYTKRLISDKQYIQIQKYRKEHTIYSILTALEERRVRVITILDDQYPKLLKEIADPPIVIFYKGALSVFSETCFGIVGSRNNTPYGKMACQKFASELSQAGLIIVSGCMIGIDAYAHQATINSGGLTIGVLGFGFDYWYPSQTVDLGERIIKSGGVLISEYPPQTRPCKGSFVARNRLIAGLAIGLLVVEAEEKSGSHITASFSLEEGRQVFAVPGSILSPYSRGTNSLIRQGALPVGQVEDILDELSLSYNLTKMTSLSDDLSENSQQKEDCALEQAQLLEILKTQALSADDLVKSTSLPISVVMANLSLLELRSLVVRDGILWFRQR